MLEELTEYKGQILVNGKSYTTSNLPDFEKLYGEITIELIPNDNVVLNSKIKITVGIDMTENGYGMKEFHKKWNNNTPMPYRRMEGYIINETENMYKLELESHGVKWKGYVLKDYIDNMENLYE